MLFINLEKSKVWDPSHDSKLKDQLNSTVAWATVWSSSSSSLCECWGIQHPSPPAVTNFSWHHFLFKSDSPSPSGRVVAFFLTTLLIPVMFRRVESPAGSPVVVCTTNWEMITHCLCTQITLLTDIRKYFVQHTSIYTWCGVRQSLLTSSHARHSQEP